MESKQHWENRYRTNSTEAQSWYQLYPTASMDFIVALGLPFTANIIDIGGGDTNIAGALIEKGYQNIWVLDISANAIEKAKKRLGENAAKVHWVVADVTAFIAPVYFDLWHDRAAFHFLTADSSISRYISIAKAAIKQNGHLLLGTFSENGPATCSGLTIQQYSESSMAARFSKAFGKIRCVTENHITPFNTIQNFLFCIFKKKP